MIVSTKFFTVRSQELAAVGNNEEGNLFLVFKSGSTQNVKYSDPNECKADVESLNKAMRVDEPGVLSISK